MGEQDGRLADAVGIDEQFGRLADGVGRLQVGPVAGGVQLQPVVERPLEQRELGVVADPLESADEELP